MELILLAVCGSIVIAAGLTKTFTVVYNMVNNLNETHEALSRCDFKN